jgi:hypothetical protein
MTGAPMTVPSLGAGTTVRLSIRDWVGIVVAIVVMAASAGAWMGSIKRDIEAVRYELGVLSHNVEQIAVVEKRIDDYGERLTRLEATIEANIQHQTKRQP